MKKITLGLVLLITASTAMSGNDIWQTLFKEKLQEARQGNSNAQFDIGSMYKNGRGVPTDRNEAIEWYRKSAAQGNQKAVSRLNLIQSNEARFSKELAKAESGNKESQYKIGNMYTDGTGTQMDLMKAAEAFEQSAYQGYAKAEYKFGLCHYKGVGVEADRNIAYKWFKLAADKGYPAAQYYLGKMYASGEAVKRDYATSLEWYTKAVEGGFNQARSEMIEISRKMEKPEQTNIAVAEKAIAPEQTNIAVAEKAIAPEQTNIAVVEKTVTPEQTPPAAVKKAVVRNPEKVAETRKLPVREKTFGIEDLMVAAWSRDGEPVAYLPSAINNCRTEEGKISCYSDNQIRATADSEIKFKTKSIMRNFLHDGSFRVIYRNLVIDVTEIATAEETDEMDEIGAEDVTTAAYAIKTGWGKEHSLECQMKDISAVSCRKDRTHSFLLESPQTVAAGS